MLQEYKRNLLMIIKSYYDELKRIKKGINENEYKDWFEKYHNLEVRDINDYFEEEDKKILKDWE